MNEGTETKPNVTKWQMETVAAVLEALDIHPVHWGNTVFGRLVGLSVWLATVIAGLALVMMIFRS